MRKFVLFLRHFGSYPTPGPLPATATLALTLFSGEVFAQTAPQVPADGMYHFFAEAIVGSGVGHAGLGPTIGGRVGYAVGTTLRGTISAVVTYHFGNADSVAGATPSTGYELAPRRLYTGVELGVELFWRVLRVRPYFTFGRLATNIDCAGTQCAGVQSSVFALKTTLGVGPGVDVLATIGIVTFGVDARWLLGADSSPTSDLFSATAVVGVNVP